VTEIEQKVWRSRGYIPHFDKPGLVQMLTIRLFDSLPKGKLQEVARRYPSYKVKERRRAMEVMLDKGHGSCWLRRPDIATLTENTLLHFDSERYYLLGWVVMPNHVHMLMQLDARFPLEKIMHSIKSFTANQGNKLLKRSGHFWQREYFDRFIRDDGHLRAAVQYIHYNPVAAKLVTAPEQWRFSSAKREK
jgi:REP element-mobilizing transposase RayT